MCLNIAHLLVDALSAATLLVWSSVLVDRSKLLGLLLLDLVDCYRSGDDEDLKSVTYVAAAADFEILISAYFQIIN